MAEQLLEGVVDTLPKRSLKPLLLVVLTLLGYIGWDNYRPERLLAGITARLDRTNVDVSVLKAHMDSLDATVVKVDAMQRWMCFQNRTDAVKAGMPCKSLTEE